MSHQVIREIEQEFLRQDIPEFRPGDTVRVHVRIRERRWNSKTKSYEMIERIQVFEGVVMRRRGSGLSASFTVRKISGDVGVERTFPLHSPVVAKIEVVRHGRVRRARLYYLRGRYGRAARISERRRS